MNILTDFSLNLHCHTLSMAYHKSEASRLRPARKRGNWMVNSGRKRERCSPQWSYIHSSTDFVLDIPA